VLFLDADNFAVQDPSVLFETPEFEATGALLWQDFWEPSAAPQVGGGVGGTLNKWWRFAILSLRKTSLPASHV
jgi:alpha 1,2-mannosyltransferase